MRVFSGIQPTGLVHLGNYFGALRNWVKLQNEGNDCFYSIVNHHAITLPQDPDKLREWIFDLACVLLAVGLDPEKSTIFVQSDVPAHTELAWVLNCIAPMGQMERMIAFKEKAKEGAQVSLGLFAYPVLMAADILLYKTDLVPVGIDQAQHLELARILAEKFNRDYSDIFKVPKTLHTETTKVVGLDGTAKMSKSKNNFIGLTESEDEIWEKLRVAATDPARIRRTDKGNPEICNIYSLHKLFSSIEDQNWVKKGCSTAEIGCIECKKKLLENMFAHLKPIRESYLEWKAQPEKVREILAAGAAKAQAVAQVTLDEVYTAIGYR